MQVLIETRMNSLKLTESKVTKKGCLGRLEGVCADFKNPTRNGRKYPLGLWKKVFSDNLFKESLQNKTLFGELDHPEDRFEPLISEACVVMTDYRIDEDAGLIYGGFDILDTPKGRILKSILDYGSVVGVSSRGQGDIVESSEGECVDEDSYDFACFDVVSTPAVEKARQKVTESVKRINAKNFKESVETQIKEAETVADLNIIRSVVRTSKLNDSDMDSLIESIEDRCNILQNVGETITTVEELQNNDAGCVIESANTIRDNKKLYHCITDLRKKISAYKHRESRYLETMTTYKEQLSSLQDQVDRLKRFSSKAKTNLSITNKKLLDTESLLSSTKKSLFSLKKERVNLSRANEQLQLDNKKLTRQLEELKESITVRLSKKDKDIDKLTESVEASNKRVTYLEEQLNSMENTHESEITSLDSEVDNYSMLLEEARKKVENGNSTISTLKETITNLRSDNGLLETANRKLTESITTLQRGYLKHLCKANGLDPKLFQGSLTSTTTSKEIETLVESYRTKLDNMNSLGITSEGLPYGDGYLLESVKSTPKTENDIESDNLMGLLLATQKSL